MIPYPIKVVLIGCIQIFLSMGVALASDDVIDDIIRNNTWFIFMTPPAGTCSIAVSYTHLTLPTITE